MSCQYVVSDGLSIVALLPRRLGPKLQQQDHKERWFQAVQSSSRTLQNGQLLPSPLKSDQTNQDVGFWHVTDFSQVAAFPSNKAVCTHHELPGRATLNKGRARAADAERPLPAGTPCKMSLLTGAAVGEKGKGGSAR